MSFLKALMILSMELFGLKKVQNSLQYALLSQVRHLLPDSHLTPADTVSGQGAQWAGMGLQLLENFPVFYQSMKQSEAELTKLGADWYLIAELNKDKTLSRINEAELS